MSPDKNRRQFKGYNPVLFSAIVSVIPLVVIYATLWLLRLLFSDIQGGVVGEVAVEVILTMLFFILSWLAIGYLYTLPFIAVVSYLIRAYNYPGWNKKYGWVSVFYIAAGVLRYVRLC